MPDTYSLNENLVRKNAETESESEVTENAALKKEVEGLREVLACARAMYEEVTAQNEQLKNALRDQIYNERADIINAAAKKKEIYFRQSMDGELNKLAEVERELSERILRLQEEIGKYREGVTKELIERLRELARQVSETVAEERERIANETEKLNLHSSEVFGKLKGESITDETLKALGKKKNIEAFIGGNLLNKLGALFVLLGIIALSRYTFLMLSDTIKGILMFAVSGLFLAGGEYLNHKKPGVFSLGITSVGIAGLYASLCLSYFALYIIPMYPALAFCILITIGAFVLSRRYNSQTISVFALAGGYIPIISIADGITMTYAAMVYLGILNLLVLTFSFNRKWKITMLAGFFLNLAGTGYITLNMIINRPYDASVGIHQISTIVFTFFSFAMYTAIPVIGNYRKKEVFDNPDIAVLCLNTFFSSVMMYSILYAFGLSQYNGLFAIAFALVYLFLGRFVESKFEKQINAMALFYLTGLMYVVLVVPLQFGNQWLSLGWLVQGVCLGVYGILKDDRNLERAGLGICGLCLFAFMFFDVLPMTNILFAQKYSAITLGSVVVLAALLHKRATLNSNEKMFKYASLINIWFYLVYLSLKVKSYLPVSGIGLYDTDFLVGVLLITITFATASGFTRIRLILDNGVKFISLGLYLITIFSVSSQMMSGRLLSVVPGEGAVPFYVLAVSALLFLAIGVLAVIALRYMMKYFVLEARMSIEWMPLAMSIYFFILLSQIIITQYGVAFTSIVISLAYVVSALGWVAFGFWKRSAYVRKFGLGLSVLAAAKLFLIDLPDLSQGYRIVSYFAFGITLLAISFIYQYFNRLIFKEVDGKLED